MPKLPLIVIVGRPNVGKSTLFNRLVGQRRSIVTDEPGITRDRIYGECEWLGIRAEVVDTGGIIPRDEDLIAQSILKQAQIAIRDATQILLVVNSRDGLVPLDEELARLLRRTGRPLALVVNKVDSPRQVGESGEFHRLGVEPVFFVSAEHNLNIAEMLDVIFARAEFGKSSIRPVQDGSSGEEEEGINEGRLLRRRPGEIRVAIIGRPNVGKSTLLNTLCGKERSIVTPIAGTTRDSVDAVIEREGTRFRIIDTAGIRRKGKTKLLAERLSVVLARKHLEQADVAVLLIDAVEGVTALDATIAGYAHEAGKSVILAVNKWDLVKKTADSTQQFEEKVRQRAKYLDYAPILFISALTGQRVTNLLNCVKGMAGERERRIPTAELNRFVNSIDFSRATVPVSSRSKILYATQTSVAPPTFVLFTNRPSKFHFGFERFLINRFREHFGFLGTPIRIKQRMKK
ncbi:MAG: ribosome biogenesis GTPase Der [Acidobacteriia bacterium]|nr:ribosome biogenesis GTPase Der [Terriglobia bacterium]